MTDDYNNSLSRNNNCTINENNIVILTPSILLTKPCGLSFLCLLSLMVYTLIKPFFNNNSWRNFYTQIILPVHYNRTQRMRQISISNKFNFKY